MKQEVINKLKMLLSNVENDEYNENELEKISNKLDELLKSSIEDVGMTKNERKEMMKYFFAGWYVYSMLEKE